VLLLLLLAWLTHQLAALSYVRQRQLFVTGSQHCRQATAAVVPALIGFVSGVSTASVRRSVELRGAGEVVAVSAGHAVTRATTDRRLTTRLRHVPPYVTMSMMMMMMTTESSISSSAT